MDKSGYFYSIADYGEWNELMGSWDIQISVKHLILDVGESLEKGKLRIQNEKNFLQEFPPPFPNTIEHWKSWKLRNPEPEKPS